VQVPQPMRRPCRRTAGLPACLAFYPWSLFSKALRQAEGRRPAQEPMFLALDALRQAAVCHVGPSRIRRQRAWAQGSLFAPSNPPCTNRKGGAVQPVQGPNPAAGALADGRLAAGSWQAADG